MAKSDADKIVPLMKADPRKAITLAPAGAVMSVINQVLQQDAVKIALSSFLEGRELQGKWALRISAAEIVPVSDDAS